VLLGSKGKRVNVDASVGGTGVVLEGLDNVKVAALTLGDTILAVELQLGSDDRVLTPAVHVKGGLSEHEGAGIGYVRSSVGARISSIKHVSVKSIPTGTISTTNASTRGNKAIKSTGHLEDTTSDEGIFAGGLSLATKDMDGRGQRVNGISVVEGLGSEDLEEGSASLKRRAIVNVGIRLDNPDELLAGVVEVDLDLVGRRSDRLITSVLELLNEVLMGVRGHLSALVSIQEDEINIDRGGNKRLLVGSGDRLSSRGGSQRLNSPQALTNRSEVNVDLNLVVLESNKGKSKTGVSAEPKEEGNVESGLRQGIAGSANLTNATSGGTRTVDVSKAGISDVSQLSGVANHLVVSSLLLGRQGELIPDVHPVTILAVNSLAADLNLNLRDELLTGEIQPTSINTGIARNLQALVNLRESNLDIGAVSKISVSGDGATDTATEVSLAVESLLNRLHGEVGVASIRHLPVSDFRTSGKEYVLGSVGY
jgi:hypothetical protein